MRAYHPEHIEDPHDAGEEIACSNHMETMASGNAPWLMIGEPRINRWRNAPSLRTQMLPPQTIVNYEKQTPDGSPEVEKSFGFGKDTNTGGEFPRV